VEDKRRSLGIRGIWRLILAIVGVVAIVQELRKPEEERTWHGDVAGLVPYDFRMPTVARMRDTYWNPEGSVVSSKVFGVGWAPNFGALARMFGWSGSRDAESPASEVGEA
jgi:hypothetical protein